MSVAPTQCQLLAITSRKADLEYRLLCITNTLSRLSCQSAAIHENLLSEVLANNEYETVSTSEENRDVAEKIEALNSSEFYIAYETQLKRINSQETILDVEKTQIETEIKALTTLNEGLEKQLDSDLKKSVLST